jgi:hypothetical protein
MQGYALTKTIHTKRTQNMLSLPNSDKVPPNGVCKIFPAFGGLLIKKKSP